MRWGSVTVEAWISAIGVGREQGDEVREQQPVREPRPVRQQPPLPPEPDGARWVVERIQKLY